MMRRLGVDTVSVARLELAVARSGRRFLDKAFTAAELAYCDGRAERLAGRWAAKEAVIKCFHGTTISFPRRKIEVLPGEGGAPQVRLLGYSKGAQIEISITHAGGIAVATALLEVSDQWAPLLPVPSAVSLPVRPVDAHKGSFGTVVALAGSLGLTGAAYLCATAAARAGAGMVRLLVAQSIYPVLAVKCTEVMATPVAEVAPGAVGHSALDHILRVVNASSAAVIGPGLGRDTSTWRLVVDLVSHAQVPLVLDADALNAMADHRRILSRLGPGRVLTPHPGEMARLVRRSISEVGLDRRQAAAQAAAEWGAVVVLKGARTIIAAPDGRICEDPHQVPALASGGTGDVLAGIIAGLLAQGSDPFTAAASGVYIHAAVGRRITAIQGDSGLLASDLLPLIPGAMATLREGGL